MKKGTIVTMTALTAFFAVFAKHAKADTGDFVLFDELSEISGINLVILIAALVITIILAVSVVMLVRRNKTETIQNDKRISPTRALVFGALCLSLSFVLSYLKLFEMPYGGSITLCSMLPITLYAAWFGPAYGFTAAFCYGLLQFVQGAYVVHFAQLFLDYILAFTVLGVASLFRSRKLIPLGILVAGFARMLCSVLSGVIFFAEYAPAGMNVWAYSFIYNFLSLGIDALICFIIYIIPPVNKAFDRIKNGLINN